jgi:hypothetical protein
MSQKVIIIDTISTILTNGSFLKDEIPRALSNYIRDGFHLWLNEDNIGIDLMDYPCIPFWLKQSLVFINKEILDDNQVLFDKSSFIITNNYNRAASLKLNLKIYTNKEIFNIDKYQKLDIADAVLCFGFNITEFNRFCKEANLLGFYDDEYYNKNVKNHDGLAFLITEMDVKKEFEYIQHTIKDLITKNKYTIKHDEYIIGVSYKGQGVDGINLNIINGEKLPLLLV